MSILQLMRAVSGYWQEQKEVAERQVRTQWQTSRWQAWKLMNVWCGGKIASPEQLGLFTWERGVIVPGQKVEYKSNFPDKLKDGSS